MYFLINTIIKTVNRRHSKATINLLSSGSQTLSKLGIKSKNFLYFAAGSNFVCHNQMSTANDRGPRLIVNDLTKNITYFSEKPKMFNKNTFILKNNPHGDINEQPLALLFSWMLGTNEQLGKYAKIYTDLGFDAVAVKINPWQLLWPVSGSQVVASDILKFLYNNQTNFNIIVLHGFSVGGYVLGEVMLHMKKDLQKYKPLLDKFNAQIWDSAADISEIPTGFPIAVFPDKPFLQKTFRRYLVYHMKKFEKQATIHYMKSSEIFHKTLIKSPALFLLCKNDPIGAVKSNLSVKNSWESLGIQCTWKCWDKSKHILHYKFHKDEYFELVLKHLNKYVLNTSVFKQRAKL